MSLHAKHKRALLERGAQSTPALLQGRLDANKTAMRDAVQELTLVAHALDRVGDETEEAFGPQAALPLVRLHERLSGVIAKMKSKVAR